MSKIKLKITGVFLFIITVILLLQIDDDIDPKAQSMFEQATAHKESKAYLYLFGMQAAIDEDPEVVGKALMASVRDAEKRYFVNPRTNKYFGYVDYPSEKKLPLPELGTCKGNENKCEYIDKLFSYQFDLEALSAEQKTLLERYNRFLSMKDLNTLPLPLLEAPLPPFQYIMKGNSLASLEAIAKARNGNIKEAKKQLLDEISLLRFQLQRADALVIKMIFTSALLKTLDVLSVLVHQYDSPMENNIQALNADERSLVKAVNYEYAMGHYMFKALDRNSNFFNKDINVPGWLVRVLFKPNMTLNATFPVLRQIGQQSLLTSKEFALDVAGDKPTVKPKVSIRNYVGAVLGEVARPDFNEFVERVFYLDAKIKLFNILSKKTKLPAMLSHINNPFYENKTAYYSEDNKAICIEAPLLHKRKDYQCLRVK